MPTTIQINRETHMVLKSLRASWKLNSYNEVIMKMVAKATKPEKSLCGVLGKATMKEILEGLRDKHDKY